MPRHDVRTEAKDTNYAAQHGIDLHQTAEANRGTATTRKKNEHSFVCTTHSTRKDVNIEIFQAASETEDRTSAPVSTHTDRTSAVYASAV